jgi:hypothetical protein
MGLMNTYYYVNNKAQPTGEHEVHAGGCAYLAFIESSTPLGPHVGCHSALAAARTRYPHWVIDGCATCSAACHTR